MNKNNDIQKVLRYIEENIRVTEQTSIEYLDSQGNIDRLSLKQNHIIFGRRGSGKSLLLKSLKEQHEYIFVPDRRVNGGTPRNRRCGDRSPATGGYTRLR